MTNSSFSRRSCQTAPSMLVRPFSDLHVEFWQPNKIPRILEMVIPPLSTDQETVALVAGDIGLAHRQEAAKRGKNAT